MAGRRFERQWRILAALSLVFASVVFVESPSSAAPGDLDDDGLLDVHEDTNTDGDFDPSTLSGPDTDGDGTANYLDADDDGDGAPTASEEPDPNADGDPRDAKDTDRDGQPDYLDMPTANTDGIVKSEQKVSSLFGGLTGPLDGNDLFGSSVTSMGDLDGDGVNDLAVGASGDEDGFSNAGAVYILFLNADGTVKGEQKVSATSGGLTLPLDGNDLFGSSVTSVGDLDGDGVNDLAVGSSGDDDGFSNAGAVYILFLNADGTVKGEQKISAASGGLTGPLVTDDFFGASISGIGDLDGDGVNDLAVGSSGDEDGFSDAGAVYIMFLNADGTVKGEQKISSLFGGLTGPLEKDDFFGASLSGIGDLDGDGAIDLLVGATGDDDTSSDAGATHILFLNPNGTVKGEQKISSLFGGLTGPLEKDDFFGASLSGIGDLDGDGAIDLLVGATGDDDVTGETGALYVLQLAPTAHRVNSSTDISDANLLDGLCDTGSTNSQGAPACSLRAAIEQANATNGSERIEFDLPSTEAGYTGSYWTIQPTSILPQIVETVQIDGTTQPGYSSAPLINIDGAILAGAGDGLFVAAGADATTINGLALTAFPYAGIVVDANAVSISDNHVGVRPDGATAAGNLAEGIIVASTASGTTIRRNVVGANRAAGVVLNALSTGTIITGNLIGTDTTGLIDLGNEQGIWADTSGTAIIGGDGVGDGNTIAYSTMDGIELQNSGLGISALGNSIFNNGQLGINAVDPGDPASGVTPNDSGDGDTGPNGLLNFPVVTSSSISGSIVTLAGTYDVPAGSYRFEIFSNPAGGDASGFGEGGQYVGTSTLTHTGSGAEGWGLAFVGTVGDELTLTLTEDLGNGSYGATSEFSAVEVIGLVLVVNSTSDSGDNSIGDGTCDTGATVGVDPECTLRAAIEEANAFAGDEAIRFAIPTGDAGYTASPLAFTIAPSSLLPAISTPMTIDGSTQSQYSTEGRPVIEIDGTNVSAAEENGLYLTGGGATIRGLVINNWGDDGIDIEFNGGNTIVGNYIGTNVTGTAAHPNAWGINFKTGANIIGGANPADRNVVSGNTNDGLYIYTAAATGNVVQGNYVGTNAAGTAAVANGRYGLYIWSGANGNTIGGATPAHGNVVSGNGTGEGGILIDGATSSGNTVRHNFIGANAAGNAAIPNNLHGLSVDGAPNTQVLDNLISGNDGHGIYLSNSNNNTIQANSIGTNVDGSIDLGNALTGVYTDVFGSSNNLIGGAVAGEGNTIAFNGEGITFLSGTENAIIGNDIYTNDSLGIDFDNDGVTTNSNADAWLNYPAITSAVAGAGTITIDFDLEAPAGDYRIEFFKNSGGADPTGFGEGQAYVDTYNVVSHPGGIASYNATTPGAVGDIISTTVTKDFGGGLFGATSEFSAVATVVAPGSFIVNSTGDAGDATPGDGACDTGGTNSGGVIECTLRAAIEEANALAGTDTISFNMPATEPGHAAGTWTISPSTALPIVNSPMVIDATSQAGYSTPVVRLDGNTATGATGIDVGGNGDLSQIRALMITDFDADGIYVDAGATSVEIRDNWIGSDGTGAAAMGNGDDGIDLFGINAVIDGNVVNNSTDEGIDVRGAGATITGNHIGLEADGSSGAGNIDVGIAVFAPSTQIGGATLAERNVISMNNEGIEINTNDNVVEGNYIGTDATGVFDRGNRVGDGVEVQGGNNNRIGGANPTNRNVIAFNQLKGVDVISGSGNSILRNNIHSNGGLGIDVGTAGVTANSGSDSWLNYPIITAAFDAAGTVTVDFDIDVPAGDYRIEAFSNPSGADPSGNGEGEQYKDSTLITHTGSGAESFQLAYIGAVGDNISLTATEDPVGPAYGATSEFSANATVVASNSAPTLDPVGAQSVDETVLLAFTATASDPDIPADTLTFTLEDGTDTVPTGATISGGGDFTWTPSETQGGNTYSFKIRVTDDGAGPLLDEQEILFTINDTNTAPVLGAISDQISAEGQTLTLTPTASDPDVPVDTLAWSVTGLPAGLTLDTASGVITGAASYTAAAGSPYSVDLTVDDGNGGTDSVAFAWTVTNTNRAPSITSPGNLSGDELVPVSISFAASDPDIPADALTFSASGLPTGATLDTATGSFGWTPTESQGPGTYTLTITVDDNGAPNLSSSITFDITVGEVNTTPALAPIASVNVDPLSTVSFTATASDSDIPANALTFSATGLPPGASLNSASGAFSWTPGAAYANSNHAITVTVTDSGGMTDSQSFTIGVNGSTTTTTTPAPTTTTTSAPTTTTTSAPTTTTTTTPTTITTAPSDNQTPVAGPFSALSIAEHQQISYRVAASDPDGDALVFGLIDAPAGLRIGRTTGTITWTPTESQGPRRHDFSVRVNDGSSSDLIVPVSINVLEVNEAPTLASPTKQIVAVGSLFTYGLAAADIDVPNNTLRYSVVDGPVGLTVDLETGMISWIPQPSDGGQTVTVRVRVDDNGTPARGTTTSFELEVSPDALPFTHVIVRGDTFATSYGQAILLDVLANDVGRDLKIESVTQPASGTAMVRDDGIWFEPAIGFAGVISIEYVAVGSDGSTGTASVMIEVASPRLNDVDNSINIDLWDYTPAASVAEPLTFSGVGSAMIDALSGLRIPTRLLILSGAWVFVFSLSVTRITRQWKFAAISNVPRGESVQVLSWTGTKTRFRFRHDADLLWVSARRVRRHGAWYRRVETPAGKGLIPDEYIDDMLDVYLDGRA